MQARMDIRDWPLPYAEKLPLRPLADIGLVILHCTELPDLAMAREYGERVLYDTGTGNSGHFYIDRDGGVSQWVPVERIAHHCRGYNPSSIGIELVNTGRYPDWFDSRSQVPREAYPTAQVEALVALLAALVARIPALAQIAGHEDLDRERVPASDDASLSVPRKCDPGPCFDWDALLARTTLVRVAAPDAR
jgi:N-acetylmuramoyl-L-alanine amidase